MIRRRIETERDRQETQENFFGAKGSYIEAITAFSDSLFCHESIEDVIREITDHIIDKMGFEDCVIYLFEPEGNLLRQFTAFGPKNSNGSIVDPIILRLGEGIVGATAKSHQPQLISDTSKDTRYIMDDKRRASEMSVPIIHQEELIAVIDSEHSQKNFFTNDHLNAMKVIASLAGIKLKKIIERQKREESETQRLELLTKKEAVQRSLRESEGRMRAIIDSALDAVITINKQGVITKWNQQAEKTFGFSASEAIGKTLTKTIIPLKYREGHSKGMANYAKTGEGPVLNKRIEITAINKSGHEFPIELSITPIKINGDFFFSAFLRDITVEKESKLEMERALQKAKELNELKSQFVTMTSHEFRTPLTTVQNNIELIGMHLENETIIERSKIDRSFSRIINQVEHLTNMLNDILTLGRLEAGRMPFTQEKMWIMDVITQAIDSVNMETNHAKFEEVGAPYPIYADHSLLQHVFANILSNAVKYSAVTDKISVQIHYQSDEVSISIIDRGIGIPENEHKNLFQSFYRASNAANIQGTGLGLVVVKEFVKMHKGKIYIESALNEGTKVTVKLPRHE